MQSTGIKTLKSLIPRRVRLIVGEMFGWLWVSEDIWQEQWRQHLDTLRKGGSLEPDPGLVGDKEYITKCVLDYYGSFEGLKVLGAGCGTGRLEAWLASAGADVVCLDNVTQALEVSRIHAERARCLEHFVTGDLERMPFKGKTFDLIYSGGVLEHFCNPETALSEYFRVTKPNGVIIVSVPNLVGHNAVFGIKPLVELILLRTGRRRGHIEQDFSARRFRKVIQSSGFKCLDISPTYFNTFDYFPFKQLKSLLSTVRIYSLYCQLLNTFSKRFPGLGFGYSFMIAFAQRPATLK